MEIEAMKKLILLIPGKIKFIQTTSYDLEIKIANYQKRMKETEMEIMGAVAREMDGSRPKYPNDKLRNAEIMARLNKNRDYKEMTDNLLALAKQKHPLVIDLEYERNHMKVLGVLIETSK